MENVQREWRRILLINKVKSRVQLPVSISLRGRRSMLRTLWIRRLLNSAKLWVLSTLGSMNKKWWMFLGPASLRLRRLQRIPWTTLISVNNTKQSTSFNCKFFRGWRYLGRNNKGEYKLTTIDPRRGRSTEWITLQHPSWVWYIWQGCQRTLGVMMKRWRAWWWRVWREPKGRGF